MKYLPEQLVKENEDYITIPAIRIFAKNNNIKKISTCDRPELLQELDIYADQSVENAEKLQDWFENVLSEGIKTVYMVKSAGLKESYLINKAANLYGSVLSSGANTYIKNVSAQNKLTTYRIFEYKSSIGQVVRFSLTKKVSFLRKVNDILETIHLPIQIVMLLDHDVILVQFKTKAGLYSYAETRDELEDSLSDDKIANEALLYLRDVLQIEYSDNDLNKKTLYNLLQKYTQTPECIGNRLYDMQDDLLELTDLISDNLCCVPEFNKRDILWDITNIIEKYISINTEDKSIFTEDRDAYPVKLISSDEEDSRVEQCSGNIEPLQMKSIFFDNKKMMQKSEQCDGIRLKFHRIDNTYFNKEVDVSIQVKKKYMIIKFTSYTMQEDMENVLNSIISSQPRP